MAKLHLLVVILAVAQICLAQTVTQEKCKNKGGEYTQIFGNAVFTSNTWNTLTNNRNTTLATVCLKYHEDCLSEGANCPLYITLNTGYIWFDMVDGNNRIIVMEAEFDWTNDPIYGYGSPIKNSFAALPRAVAANFPGLDRTKVYLVGWSSAAAGIARGLMETGRGADRSPYGATSNVYAAVATIGGCAATDNADTWGRPTDTKMCGQFHVFSTVGQNDTTYTRDECLGALQILAVTNGCSRTNSDWCEADNNDPYTPHTTTSSPIRYIDFGTCKGGDVRGYSFNNQGRVTTYTTPQPDIIAYDMVWAWLQGRTKPFNEGQLGPHEGTSQFCNRTITPATAWSYQREICDVNGDFETTDAKFTLVMPAVGLSTSPATALAASVTVFVALAAFILA